jgi:hypothetical protein
MHNGQGAANAAGFGWRNGGFNVFFFFFVY